MNKMPVGITKQYELTSSRAVIIDCITSNITDPLTDVDNQDTRTDTDHWVFEGFPNPADIGKPAPKGWKFPIVVIDYPDIETENKTVDGSKQMITQTFTVECYSRRRSESNSLAQEIKHILETTEQTNLRKAAIFGPDLIDTSHDTDFIGGNKYYSVILEFEFKRFD